MILELNYRFFLFGPLTARENSFCKIIFYAFFF